MNYAAKNACIISFGLGVISSFLTSKILRFELLGFFPPSSWYPAFFTLTYSFFLKKKKDKEIWRNENLRLKCIILLLIGYLVSWSYYNFTDYKFLVAVFKHTVVLSSYDVYVTTGHLYLLLSFLCLSMVLLLGVAYFTTFGMDKKKRIEASFLIVILSLWVVIFPLLPFYLYKLLLYS